MRYLIHIHNGTFKSFFMIYELDNNVNNFENWLISIVCSLWN